jgi:hypothetical protein
VGFPEEHRALQALLTKVDLGSLDPLHRIAVCAEHVKQVRAQPLPQQSTTLTPFPVPA